MEGVSLKGKDEALYAYKGRWNSKQYIVDRTKKNEDKAKSNQGERSTHVEGDSKNPGTKKNLKGSVITAGRRVTWQNIVGQKKGLWKVILLLPKAKMSGTLRHLLLQ
ncbi:hypothetical protein CsSME_00003210 [Camellia sinensis var. sinensis]